jgi:hypothetical protein
MSILQTKSKRSTLFHSPCSSELIFASFSNSHTIQTTKTGWFKTAKGIAKRSFAN